MYPGIEAMLSQARAPIPVSVIREATQRDPVLSRVVYFLQHGWLEERSLPEELRFTSRSKMNSPWLSSSRVVIVGGVAYGSPWDGANEVLGALTCVVVYIRLKY